MTQNEAGILAVVLSVLLSTLATALTAFNKFAHRTTEKRLEDTNKRVDSHSALIGRMSSHLADVNAAVKSIETSLGYLRSSTDRLEMIMSTHSDREERILKSQEALMDRQTAAIHRLTKVLQGENKAGS